MDSDSSAQITQDKVPKTNYSPSVGETPVFARKTACTYCISMAFVLIALSLTTYLKFNLFHMENSGTNSISRHEFGSEQLRHAHNHLSDTFVTVATLNTIA